MNDDISRQLKDYLPNMHEDSRRVFSLDRRSSFFVADPVLKICYQGDLRIMYIDDDQDTCDLISMLFYHCTRKIEFVPIDFHTYTSFEAAKMACSSWQPNVIITDMHLTGENSGNDVVVEFNKMRKEGKEILIIMNTVLYDIDDVNSYFKIGTDAFFPKPTDVPLMYHYILQCCQRVTH